MTDARSVLVLTDRYDPTADLVVEELNRRDVTVFRCDTREFPTALAVGAELTGDGWSGRAWTARRSLDLAAISGIYYRRPTAFAFHREMSVEERRWANVQARLGFGGLLASLRPWLNHPHSIGYAEYKPVQLHAALAVGRHRHRWHASVFATRVTPEQAGNSAVAHTMHLFQQWAPKEYEVRLTVVDDQFFAARISARSRAARVDWRADYHSLDYTAIDTPELVRTRVMELLRRLDLRFGAMDFVVAPDGEWWFLECNPNGQWAWIEAETAMPITAALADALESKAKL